MRAYDIFVRKRQRGEWFQVLSRQVFLKFAWILISELLGREALFWMCDVSTNFVQRKRRQAEADCACMYHHA